MSFIVEIDNQNKVESSEKSRSHRKNSSKSKSKSKIYSDSTDNLSLSDLDLIANKRKLAKDTEKKDTETKVSSVSSIRPERAKTDDLERGRSRDAGWNPRSSARYVNENEDPQIRREKSEYLYKFNKLNTGNKFSSCQFDMNSPLSEIRNEYDRIKNGLENERSVKFLQRMMLLMIQGVEMMNTKFDPLGIDLDGWGESMAYSLETQEYDEVLSELYEKYKGAGNMSPELKLLFMIISSASMFAITKRLTKNDSGLGNLINSLVGRGGGGGGGNGGHRNEQQRNEQQPDTTSSNEDILPSKLEGPMGDEVSINEILSKMQQSRIEKQQQQRPQQSLQPTLPKIDESVDLEIDVGVDEKTEDIFKNIVVQPKRRGRPRQKITKSVAPPF
jgi:hypothetical protein